MGIKKFIAQVQKSFQSDKHQKIAFVKRWLVKLQCRKEAYQNTEKDSMGAKDLVELQENLAIITLQIKKAESLLKKLSV